MKKPKFKKQIVLQQFDEMGILDSVVVAQFIAEGDCYICFKALTESHSSKVTRYVIEDIKPKKRTIEINLNY